MCDNLGKARGTSCFWCIQYTTAYKALYLSTAELRYDTTRDAILTCARKPTWVSLIYRTGPTTKKCKNRKTKSRKQICSEIIVRAELHAYLLLPWLVIRICIARQSEQQPAAVMRQRSNLRQHLLRGAEPARSRLQTLPPLLLQWLISTPCNIRTR